MNPGMNDHLNDEQIAMAVVETDADLSAHLHQCSECSAKVEGLRASLTGFGAHMRQAGEQPNCYWWRQRGAAPAPAFSPARWAAAVTAVVVTVAVSLPFIHKTAQTNAPAPVAIQQISDEALLSEVQNDVQREYPDAFAPVQADAESESAVAAHTAAAIHKKEHKRK